MNGVSSLQMSVVSGVPQGSILGPLLFLVYIDDIATVNISDGSKIVLYADDILLYHPISIPEDLEHLQNDVDRLQAYASANYMTFNASKCKFMLVSRKRQHIHPNPSICLNGSPLELTPTFKYLGLLISSDLSWSDHIVTFVQGQNVSWGYYTGASTGNRMSKCYVSFISPLSGRI